MYKNKNSRLTLLFIGPCGGNDNGWKIFTSIQSFSSQNSTNFLPKENEAKTWNSAVTTQLGYVLISIYKVRNPE